MLIYTTEVQTPIVKMPTLETSCLDMTLPKWAIFRIGVYWENSHFLSDLTEISFLVTYITLIMLTRIMEVSALGVFCMVLRFFYRESRYGPTSLTLIILAFSVRVTLL